MNFKKILFIAGCGLAFSLGKINAQSATFNYTGSLQTWTVPCGVTSVTIGAYGAPGGADVVYGGAGGLGAGVLSQAITVASGDVIDIVAGGTGGTGSYGGGGGGGTYVWDATSSTLLVVGAGGGGAGYNCAPNNNGGAGQITVATLTLTTTSPAGGNAAGGIGGNGGTGGSGTWVAAGGAGWLSNGGNGAGSASGTPQGGADPANGAAGGCCGSSFPATGGYGGGGCGDVSGGGGGGYNGGGGGNVGTSPYPPGGGGGSYCVSGTPTTSANSGNGYATINWTVPAALTASASVSTNETCNGGSNGSASSTVTGGGTPYTYAWTGGGTNATVSGLTAGSFTLTVHDACGNSASASVSITQPTAIVATITSTSVLCNGGNSGSASSTVTGGTGAYTYAWTGGGSNSSISGLTAGTYNLNVQDANGCTGSATVTITQPNMLAVAASITANDSCNSEGIGSASSTVTGGTGAYTYAWTGGRSTDTAVGLTAGTYTLSVQDANGCTGSATVTITQPLALDVAKNSSPDNGSGNGAAWVNVVGGTSPYTYDWTPGGKTTDSISGLSAGIYCCYITDANRCLASVCDTVKSTAGIGGITSNGGQITVYPNPNNGQFTIQSSLNAVSTVEVYNVLGEKVFSGNLNAGNNTINMSNQSTGIYLYRVMSESGTLISEGKISVQK